MIQRVKDVLIGVRPYAAGTETLGLVQKFRLGHGAPSPPPSRPSCSTPGSA